MADENALISTNYCSDSALEQEQLMNLINREMEFGFKKDENVIIPSWVLEARSESIKWVLKRSAELGFQPLTAYLAIAYFDRFYSLSSDPKEEPKSAKRLLSVVCLSLAAKMEELDVKLPPLSQYAVGDYTFPCHFVGTTELAFLDHLDWRLSLITPFAFLGYLISKLCQGPASDVKSRIEKHLLSGIAGISVNFQEQSAAATLMAVDQKLTREAVEVMIKSVPDLNFLDIEAVFLCYNRMQEKELKSLKDRSIPVNVAVSSSVQQRSL
ncbi:cyclin-D5-1-like [Pyrus x bretschneideri]|uniref:cyclin-D5-1-like n=1 Tax=Pyrus x bretschneideri TaxID=225117 RepID=UPI002030ADC3|nr:cyclin-D5-1-like [Pyrus x bretschneideri]